MRAISNSCSDTGYHESNAKFTHVFTSEMTTHMQTPATSQNEKWLRIRVRCFTKILTPGPDPGPKEKRGIPPESTPAPGSMTPSVRWNTTRRHQIWSDSVSLLFDPILFLKQWYPYPIWILFWLKSVISIGLDWNWTTTNFCEFGLEPDCKSPHNLRAVPDMDWVNAKQLHTFCDWNILWRQLT